MDLFRQSWENRQESGIIPSFTKAWHGADMLDISAGCDIVRGSSAGDELYLTENCIVLWEGYKQVIG